MWLFHFLSLGFLCWAPMARPRMGLGARGFSTHGPVPLAADMPWQGVGQPLALHLQRNNAKSYLACKYRVLAGARLQARMATCLQCKHSQLREAPGLRPERF